MIADTVEVLSASGGAQLAPGSSDPFDENSNGPWEIHGVAMPEDRVLTGGAATPTYWPADVLRDATDKLEGQDIVTDQRHNPDENPGIRDVIGEVTQTQYIDGYGIGYEGEVDDRDIAQKIARDRLDASPYLYRTLTDETHEVGDREGTVANEILGFDNLAVVRNGAGGDDVGIQSGPHPDLGADAAEALAAAFPNQSENKPMSDPNNPDKTVEELQKENRELRAELRSRDSESDELAYAYAETLSEGSPFDPGELVDRYSFKELREKVETEDVVETLTPDLQTRDRDPTGDGSGTAETLSADERDELEGLRRRRDTLASHATEEHLNELDDQIETLEERTQ